MTKNHNYCFSLQSILTFLIFAIFLEILHSKKKTIFYKCLLSFLLIIFHCILVLMSKKNDERGNILFYTLTFNILLDFLGEAKTKIKSHQKNKFN